MKTQNAMILAHLRRGWKLDAIGALNKYGCFRLAARIADLRKQGHNIKTTYAHNKRNGKTYAVYQIPRP